MHILTNSIGYLDVLYSMDFINSFQTNGRYLGTTGKETFEIVFVNTSKNIHNARCGKYNSFVIQNIILLPKLFLRSSCCNRCFRKT